MAEYIERERLLEIIKSLIMPNPGLRIGKKFLNELLMSYREAVLEKIQEAPAADVVPVRHGRCVEISKGGKTKRIFSCCGEDFTQLTMWCTPHYCPNCGARMDEEE